MPSSVLLIGEKVNTEEHRGFRNGFYRYRNYHSTLIPKALSLLLSHEQASLFLFSEEVQAMDF